LPKFKRKEVEQMFMGVDPGESGAFAIIDNNNTILELHDWPGDEIALADLILSIMSEIKGAGYSLVAAIEKVHSMPKQGVASSFKFGTNFGIWRMGMAMAKIPFYTPPPQQWQKGILHKAQDKKPALAAAGRLFPKAELYGPRGGGKDGRADALLIAYWCKNQNHAYKGK
jgi:hypothetical protein